MANVPDSRLAMQDRHIGLAFVVILCCLLVAGNASAVDFPIPVYSARQAQASPRIDGQLDEPCWETATEASGFTYYQRPEQLADVQTSFRVTWDEAALYIGVLCEEPHADDLPSDSLARDDAAIFKRETVEIFIDPLHSHTHYYHLAVDSSASIYDCSGGALPKQWDGMTTAAVAVGKATWSVEAAVSWQSLGIEPRPGQVLGLNVCRDRKLGIGSRQYSHWSPVAGPPRGFHDPPYFGHLLLSPSERSLSLWEVTNTAQTGSNLSVRGNFSYSKSAFYAELSYRGIEPEGAWIDLQVIGPAGNKVTAKRIPLAENDRSDSASASITTFCPVDSVETGNYQLKAQLINQKGEVVEYDAQPISCISPPDWLGTDMGISEQVPPPFTPLVVKRDQQQIQVSCWGREQVFGSAPFLTAIKTGGVGLLSRPMQFVTEIGGRAVDWQPRLPQLVVDSPSQVVVRQQAVGQQLDAQTNVTIEYDGFIRVDWSIAAKVDVTIDKLQIALPIDARYAKYLYCWPGKQSGALDSSFVSDFKPIIWLGDEERGLCWVAESDENWSLADESKAVEILKGPEEVVVWLNLIDKPTVIKQGEYLDYSFGLQATPVKPMQPTCWDMRLERLWPYANEYAWLTKQINGQPYLEFAKQQGGHALLVMRWWDVFSYTLPIGHEQEFPKLVDGCHRYGLKVIPYIAGYLLSERAPEFTYFKDDMLVKPQQGKSIARLPGLDEQMAYRACKNSIWQDFVVATIARCIDEYDIDGIYLDGTAYPFACANRLHGCGYEKPDGTVAPTYSVFATRRLMKRLYTVVKQRKPEGLVDVHMSGCFNIPALAFATSYWKGEALLPTKYVPEAVSLDRFRTEFIGTNIGVPAEFLYYRTGNYNACTGISLLHDVPTRAQRVPEWTLLSSIWRVREEFGCKQAQFLPYWSNKDLVQVGPDGCYASLYRHPRNGVLAVIANLNREEARAQATLSLDKLGLPPVVSAHDALSLEPIEVADGVVTLQLPSQAWKLVWLKPK